MPVIASALYKKNQFAQEVNEAKWQEKHSDHQQDSMHRRLNLPPALSAKHADHRCRLKDSFYSLFLQLRAISLAVTRVPKTVPTTRHCISTSFVSSVGVVKRHVCIVWTILYVVTFALSLHFISLKTIHLQQSQTVTIHTELDSRGVREQIFRTNSLPFQ